MPLALVAKIDLVAAAGGLQVGLYSANWTGHVGDANESGTRKDSKAWKMRRRMEMRNNGLVRPAIPTRLAGRS